MRFSPCWRDSHTRHTVVPVTRLAQYPLSQIPPKSSDEGGGLQGKRVLAALGERRKEDDFKGGAFSPRLARLE